MPLYYAVLSLRLRRRTLGGHQVDPGRPCHPPGHQQIRPTSPPVCPSIHHQAVSSLPPPHFRFSTSSPPQTTANTLHSPPARCKEQRRRQNLPVTTSLDNNQPAYPDPRNEISTIFFPAPLSYPCSSADILAFRIPEPRTPLPSRLFVTQRRQRISFITLAILFLAHLDYLLLTSYAQAWGGVACY